jgi:dihydrofolate reductase
MRITIVNSVTLDGVAQAPAAPDEDPRGGFRHGGWGRPYSDAIAAKAMAARMARPGPGALLLGRFTYERFYKVWPARAADGNPYSEPLNRTRKYVASRTLKGPLPWNNSVLLEGDATEAVARLKKEEPGTDLCVLGSLNLGHSLMRAELVDEYVLLITPLVLGTGFRLFPDAGAFAKLQLVETTTTTTGVIIATYRRT